MPLKPSFRVLGAGVLAVALSSLALAQQIPMEALQSESPNNWDKWGDDDQIGALNYLGENEVKTGAGAITSGKTFTLQIPMTSGTGPVFPGRVPGQHFMATDAGVYMAGKAEPAPGGMKYSDDVAFMYLQGTTHVDALAHAWYGNQIYGGKGEETSVHGHTHADVGEIGKKGIVGRAVLLDVGRHLGSDDLHRLPTDTCVTLDDLKATAEAQGTTVNKRDILVIRTGSIARFWEEQPDEEWNAMNEPGLCHSVELLNWLDNMETPMIATDNIAVEKVVQEIDGQTYIIPLHGALMRDMGVVLSEIWWLDDLAADSAEDGQYTFMLVAAPLKVEQGTGSPVNPVAIK